MVQGVYGELFAVILHILLSITCVAVQTVSKPENYQGILELKYVQMRDLPTEAERRWVSGCKNHNKPVLRVGAKAKSVTSLLTQPSVLGGRSNFFLSWEQSVSNYLH